MGAETKKIGELRIVTDTDVAYYEIGEVEGSFQEHYLKDYIKRYGHEKLCAQLGFMQFQIWRTLREINGEISENEAKSCVKEAGTNNSIENES